MAYAVNDMPVAITTRESGWEDWTAQDFKSWPMGEMTFFAHNAAFEIGIWNHVMSRRYGWPALRPEQVVCTMAMAYGMALPGALDNAAAAVGLTHQKDAAGGRVMLQLSKPRDLKPDGTPIWWEPKDAPEKFERLYAYCRQDVEVERELYKRLLPLSTTEQRLWQLDQKINQRGVAIDKRAVEAAIEVVQAETKRLQAEMQKVTGNAVATCGAVGQLKDWLRWKGYDTDKLAKADVVELLAIPDLKPECRRALELRQEAAKSSTAKLEAMLRGACDDGRLRGMFQYQGAGSTGRWAGRRVQIQNIVRGKMKPHEVEGVFSILAGA